MLTLLSGISQLATPPALGARRGAEMRELRVITDAAIAIRDGLIDWVGPRADWQGRADQEHDLHGGAVIPALVDPHTHCIWAGDRLADFEDRAAGVGYEAILARGGGIRSTVRATAAASMVELIELARPRIGALVGSGAATVEIKSGYGLSHEAELASLQAIDAIRQKAKVRIIPTLLIHLPPETAEERPPYLRMVTDELILEVAERRLAMAVDIFIERESWHLDEAAAIFRAASAASLAVKAHVDQFHAIGGVQLCVEHSALSVDHLEASGDAEIAALAESSTVATLLPGVTLHLGIGAAPGRRLIDAGAIVAVGTDLNPGSSPLFSTQQAMALSVRINGLSPAEALTASTTNAAAALGLADRGAIVPGARADIAVLGDTDWRSAVYTLGMSPVQRMYIGGEELGS
ncbi:MAG TPA: imidazolonepropionase [Gemmatimonadales bacterium]|nr:imidazolonepropionase [Gemmatimonadales bacterium]